MESEISGLTSMDGSIQPERFLEEEKKLGGSGPFKTIMKMTIGPLLFSTALALQDSIDLFFVNKGYGSEAVTIISILSSVRMLSLSLSTLFQQSSIIKFSELVTKGNHSEVNRLYMDLFKVLVGASIVIGFGISFAFKPLLSQMGMPEKDLSTALTYMIPVIISIPFNVALQIALSAMMSLGKATKVAIIELLALGFSVLADPLFIYVFKAPLWTMGIAYISGNTIAGIILTIWFFLGREPIVPKCADFKTKISPEFWQTLKLALPGVLQIGTNLASPIVLTLIISKAADKIGKASVISTVYSTSIKPYSMLISIVIGGMVGLVPAATYAHTKHNFPRLKGLTLSAMFIPYIIILTFWPIMVFKPDIIMKIWLSDPEMLSWVPKITSKMFYTLILEPISTIGGSLLVVFRRTFLATSTFLVKFAVTVCAGITILNLENCHPENVLYAMPTADIVNCIFISSLLTYSILKEKKEMNSVALMESLILADHSTV